MGNRCHGAVFSWLLAQAGQSGEAIQASSSAVLSLPCAHKVVGVSRPTKSIRPHVKWDGSYQRRVAGRKAAESLDDIEVLHGVPLQVLEKRPQLLARAVRDGLGDVHAHGLHAQILRVLGGHSEEEALDWTEQHNAPCVNRSLYNGAY